jgi:TonB family protein
MFLEYFRLREQPFGVTPDPRFLFPSAGHREALASLLYGIETGLGFGALVAQPGMGKTTLLFHILEQYRGSARTAFIFNTQCNSFDLLRALLSELDEEAVGRDTFQLHEKFKQVLATEAQSNRRVILVIDEAQNLGDMVMETVRLLSNFESAHQKLLHIILAGQQELATKLGRPELNQLQQRIPMVTQLPFLSAQDIAGYIEHRLRVAGYQGQPLFTAEAVRQIVWMSRGIPREINRLCFNSLSLAYASSKHVVDLTVIEEVAADLGLPEQIQQARQETVQQEPIAVNAAPGAGHAGPQQPRPAQVWPRAAGSVPRSVEPPRPAEPARKEPPKSIPIAAPNLPHRSNFAQPSRTPQQQVAPVAHHQVNMPRRTSTLPPIRRIRRRSYSHGWQTYKKSVGYAFFCLTLIAAGWAAMNRWVHPAVSAEAEKVSVSEPVQASPDQNTTERKTASPKTNNVNKPVNGDRSPQNAQRSQPTSAPRGRGHQASHHPSPQQPSSQQASTQQPNILLASSRSPANSANSGSSTPPPAVQPQSPPVKEPTVAAQGQMEFVKYVRPHYPEEARRSHVEGTVVLSAVVAKDGTVKGIKPVSGDPTLLKAAEAAIRDWVYRPYQINGRAVDVDTEIVINFALPRRIN